MSEPAIAPPSTAPPAPPEQTPLPLFSRIEKVAAIEDRVSLAMKTLGAVRPAASAAADRMTDSARVLADATQGLLRGVTDRLFTAPPPREVDRFGRDPQFEAEVLKFFERLYRNYFRVSVRGIENVPSTGPALLVANHSGALPWDSAMLKTALLLDHPEKRSLRPLSEDFVIHFPFLGMFLNRFGAVRACQENAEALLREGEVVAVFPEGTKGLGKPFRKRYRLQRFGRGGFVRLAMRTGVPVIPVAIVGAEEIHPLLTRIVRPVAPLGLPYVPVTPTFPLLGPLGLIPLPSKWMIEFGPPVYFDNDGADDELTIQRRTEDVRSDIQSRIDRMLAQRRSVFF